jgi:hypothetical protein
MEASDGDSSWNLTSRVGRRPSPYRRRSEDAFSDPFVSSPTLAYREDRPPRLQPRESLAVA